MLANYFRDKIAYLREFLETTRAIEGALDRGDFEAAVMLLQKRQDTATAIDKIDVHLGMTRLPRNEAIDKINNLNIDTIKIIAEINGRCIKKFMAAKNEFAGQLGMVQKQKSGINSYRHGTRSACEPRFLTSEF